MAPTQKISTCLKLGSPTGLLTWELHTNQKIVHVFLQGWTWKETGQSNGKILTIKNNIYHLILKFYHLQGELVQLSYLSQFMQEPHKTSRWLGIQVLCWAQKKQKSRGCACWQNCMPVVQHQRQQLSPQATATVISQTAIQQYTFKEEQCYNSSWYGNKMENWGLASFFALSILLLKRARHFFTYLKLITSRIEFSYEVVIKATTMQNMIWTITGRKKKKMRKTTLHIEMPMKSSLHTPEKACEISLEETKNPCFIIMLAKHLKSEAVQSWDDVTHSAGIQFVATAKTRRKELNDHYHTVKWYALKHREQPVQNP